MRRTFQAVPVTDPHRVCPVIRSDNTDRLPERHLTYYLRSKRCRSALTGHENVPAHESLEARLASKMERNERFWVVAALMSIFHSGDRTGALSRRLSKCLGERPPIDKFPSWQDALGVHPELYFEVNLPSPPSYREYLREYLDEHTLDIPSVRAMAATPLLGLHLPHRSAEELMGVPARLGWLTWEDCNEVHPNSCRWLG